MQTNSTKLHLECSQYLIYIEFKVQQVNYRYQPSVLGQLPTVFRQSHECTIGTIEVNISPQNEVYSTACKEEFENKVL